MTYFVPLGAGRVEAYAIVASLSKSVLLGVGTSHTVGFVMSSLGSPSMYSLTFSSSVVTGRPKSRVAMSSSLSLSESLCSDFEKRLESVDKPERDDFES